MFQAIERFVVVQIEQHYNEHDENHNRACVNQNLHGGDERRGERYVNARETNKDTDKRNRTVKRVFMIDKRNRARDCESGEKEK